MIARIGPLPLLDLPYRYPSSCYVSDAYVDTTDECLRCLVKDHGHESSSPPWTESESLSRIVNLILCRFVLFEERDRSAALRVGSFTRA